MNTWALIPVRSFSTGKSRLGGLGVGRRDVACALFQHVHAVVAACPLLDGVLVATDDAEVGTIARELLLDDGRQPLSAIVDRGPTALGRGSRNQRHCGRWQHYRTRQVQYRELFRISITPSGAALDHLLGLDPTPPQLPFKIQKFAVTHPDAPGVIEP